MTMFISYTTFQQGIYLTDSFDALCFSSCREHPSCSKTHNTYFIFCMRKRYYNFYFIRIVNCYIPCQCICNKFPAFEYSARDCAARPLKLSIHSGGIEHACRRR